MEEPLLEGEEFPCAKVGVVPEGFGEVRDHCKGQMVLKGLSKLSRIGARMMEGDPLARVLMLAVDARARMAGVRESISPSRQATELP